MKSDMQRTVTRWSVVAAATLALISPQQARAQKINANDQHIQELIREAAARAGVAAAGVSDTTAQATAGANGRPQVRLTLDDAIKLALDRNLDISVQRLNPQTFDFSLSALQSVYRPTLTSSVLQQSQTTAPTSTPTSCPNTVAPVARLKQSAAAIKTAARRIALVLIILSLVLFGLLISRLTSGKTQSKKELMDH